MSGGLVDKVYIGLDNAPAAFDIKSRILGPNGTNLEYIRSETGVVAVLKGDKFEPLHLVLHHARSDAIAAAKSLALNLVETIKAELVQWSTAQAAAGAAPPSMSMPPPNMVTTSTQPAVQPPASITMSTPSSLTSSAQQTIMSPVVSVASASTPLMTVRQPTVLQLLQPQQQYVLNQENGQLIPIVQPGMQMSNSISSLPIAQSLPLQQSNFGTQYVDLSSMQPVNVTQLRLSGVPSSMSMLLPNGLSLAQSGVNTSDSTTVSTATSTPVVCAAQGTNASHKILYSTEKVGDKTDIKYQIQGTDTVQWAMPGSQTMLIPYQQLQDLTANQAGLANIQNQQFVSIAPAGGLQQTPLPLSAAQFQQLQAGTIMHLNQKPITSSGSFINIISTGQASSPHVISNLQTGGTPTKIMNSQDQRGQKRMSDGTPNQLQLRPIAPAGSHVNQEKASRDARSMAATTVRENTVVSMGMKINPAHGTIIHVSSGQQTSLSSSGVTPDGSGMYIRQIDRNAIQIQANKDGQKQEMTANKIQSATQNVQMITVPQGMTVLQNPLSISQMPMLGQHNNQVYMIPANQAGALGGGLLGQQVMAGGGGNVAVMGGAPQLQYNVPLVGLGGGGYMSPHPAPAQAAPPPYLAPASHYAGLPHYVVQPGAALPPALPPAQPQLQYSMQPVQPQTNAAPNVQQPNQQNDNENNANVNNNQQNSYMAPTQENTYQMQNNQTMQTQNQTSYQNDNTTQQTPDYSANQGANGQNYASNGNNQNSYAVNQASTTQAQNYNQSNGGTPQPPAYGTPPAQQPAAGVAPPNYSPSGTPAPAAAAAATAYGNVQGLTFPPAPQNPYPNASGQNIQAYTNQYQYGGAATAAAAGPRPWFRARYPAPPAPTPAAAPAPPQGYYWPDS